MMLVGSRVAKQTVRRETVRRAGSDERVGRTRQGANKNTARNQIQKEEYRIEETIY